MTELWDLSHTDADNLTYSFSEKPYEPNAFAAVEKHTAIRQKLDPQAVAKEFLGQAGGSVRKEK